MAKSTNPAAVAPAAGQQDCGRGNDTASTRQHTDRSGEFWLNVRERDGEEFYFSGEPTTLRSLRVTLVAAGIEQTKTRSLRWYPAGTTDFMGPPDEIVPVTPRGRGWKLHSAAEHYSVWRRKTRKRKYVLHDAANASEIVYPPGRPELELGA
jgi:hypothetical protein